MKQQYVADTNDFHKFALLRRLSVGGRVRVGVFWMLTPPDDRTDGRRIDYLERPDLWRHIDPELFDALRPIAKVETVRRLSLIERSRIMPRALYFDEFVPTLPELRRAYIEVGLRELQNADLIFFDPDNGLNVPSVAKGQSGSPKFIYRDEISGAFQGGHSVAVYQHFSREPRQAFTRRLAGDLGECAPGATLWGYRTGDVVFFLIVHPRHSALCKTAANATAGWPSSFIVGEKLS